MRSILFSLSLTALVATAAPAYAEEPAGTPVRNRSGLIARNSAVVVGWGPDGCPNLRTNGAQFESAEGASEMLAAATDARTRCVLATAAATVAIAAARDRDVYVDTDGEVATGNAATLAAATNSGLAPVGALGTLGYTQTAWALTRPVIQQAPPPPPARTRPPQPPPGPTAAEVAAAEARARAAAGR